MWTCSSLMYCTRSYNILQLINTKSSGILATPTCISDIDKIVLAEGVKLIIRPVQVGGDSLGPNLEILYSKYI